MKLQLSDKKPASRFSARPDILVVDDRPDGLLAIEAVLGDEPLNLVKAGSGKEALEKLKHRQFAAILLDVQMPVMDGFETAALIRQNPAARETPIIFVTAISQDHQHVYRGYASGAVDYIFKPIDDFILKSKVRVFVDLYNQRQTILEQAELLKEMEIMRGKRRQEEMEAENLNRYANLANAIPHVVFKTDVTGKIEYLNQTYFDRYAMNGELLGIADWRSVVHPEDQIRIVRHWMMKEKNDRYQTEARIRLKDGRWRWHLVSMVAELRNYEVIGWLGTCIDIQDQKNREEQLRELSQNLNRSNRSLEQFAYIASHDLQEPLRKIITFTELIRQRSHSLSPEETQYFDRIYQSGYRMKSVIEDLLQYSCISKMSDAVKEVLDLNVLMQEVIGDLEVCLNRSGGTVHVETLPDVVGSRVQTRLLFQNLISNAIKFAQKSVPPRIHIRSESSKNGSCLIHVNDNGIGFEEKYSQKIFQPFQRLHGKGEYDGTGIGLSIVRKILDHHHWEIKVSSQPGVGSDFAICIPAAKKRKTE